MNDKILVFIPMYNCEKQIVRVIEQLKGEISSFISEVIIINNRSIDKGEEAVINKLKFCDFPFPVKLLRNKENYGLGGSHKVAFKYAADNNFDYVICLHGDDQGCISDFLPLLKSGEYRNYDCCLGSRFMKDSKLTGYSKFRIFGNIVFNIIYTISTGILIKDLGSGLNMYSVNMLKSAFFIKFPDNLTFNCYMLFAVSVFKQKYKFIAVSWREEDQISNVKMMSQAIRTFKMAINFFFKRKIFIYKEARIKKINSYEFEEIYMKS